jgi:hypothetical protein
VPLLACTNHDVGRRSAWVRMSASDHDLGHDACVRSLALASGRTGSPRRASTRAARAVAAPVRAVP